MKLTAKKAFTCSLLLLFVLFNLCASFTPVSASSQVIYTSKSDFDSGTYNSADVDSSVSPGDLKLKRGELDEYTESTKTEFDEGTNSHSENTETDDGEIQIDHQPTGGETLGTYNTSTPNSIAYISGIVRHSYLDETNNLLYVSTSTGLSVINTQGTKNTWDDTLEIKYSTTSTPALPSNTVVHSLLDQTHNLLYISTSAGLSVINTHGTTAVSDDTLQNTYSTSSDPALPENTVSHSLLDGAHNLLYVSTGVGLSAIDTQGTVSASDDTLETTYSDLTGLPGENSTRSSLLDTTNNLLYISNNGGLSIIDTLGNGDTADDSHLFTYNSSSTPAIAHNYVKSVYIDSTNHLLYISTLSGLSVVDTHGTVDHSDDTLVITYSTLSSPAIAFSNNDPDSLFDLLFSVNTANAAGPDDYVFNSFLDTENNLLYINTYRGLSVINTRGTVSPADDTLEITYLSSSTPAVLNNNVYHSFLDTENDLLYVSTGGGLSVLDTQGTINPSDDEVATNYTLASAVISGDDTNSSFVNNDLLYISSNIGLSVVDRQGTPATEDDTLVARYNSASVPAIIGSAVNHTFLDNTNHLLYISTSSGLSVINTHNTVDPSDDTIHTDYYFDSNVPIESDYIYHSFLDDTNHLLYISTDNGLWVINNQGTVDPSDDTLEASYSTTSTPAIGDNNVYHAFAYNDGTNNLLYISTSNGLSVVNTHNTVDESDDTLEVNYNSLSTPALAGNTIRHSDLDEANDLLYISIQNGGLAVVNTQGTPSSSDDALVTTYNTTSTPSLRNNFVRFAFFAAARIYVSTYAEMSSMTILDTHGTISPADDTEWAHYAQDTTPSIVSDYVKSSNLDSEDVILYVATNQGLSAIALPDESRPYYSSASYTSQEIPLDSSHSILSWEEDTASGQNISAQTRTAIGEDPETWTDNFNDGNASNVYDYYGYSFPFNSISESGGILTMTDPYFNQYAYTYIDSGMEENYFPAGSTVTARLRYVGSGATNVRVEPSTDDYETEDDSVNTPNGEWITTSIVASNPFSVIEFDHYWDNGTWNSETDKIEIDWVRVTLPADPLNWSSWSDSCSNHEGCAIPSTEGKTHIQYRFNLSSDGSSTPLVTSVTLSPGYQLSGEYLSPIINASSLVDWESLVGDQNTPTGTSIAYSTRTGATAAPDGTWSDWAPVNSPIASPDGQYLQYKVVLTTTNPVSTPTLSSVMISYSPLSSENNNDTTDDTTINPDTIPALATAKKKQRILNKDTVNTTGTRFLVFRGRMTTLAKKGTVRVYRDGRYVGKTKIGRGGKWRKQVKPRKKKRSSLFQFKYYDSKGALVDITPNYSVKIDRSSR